MQTLNSTLSQIGLFFKDAINTIPNLFSWKYLTTPPSGNFRYPIPALVILLLLIGAGFALQIITEKKIAPRFLKKFRGYIANFLIYIPLVLIFLTLARISGISGMENPIWVAFTLGVWLIFFLYLIYYRLVVVKKMWIEYYKIKDEEKYTKNVEAKGRK